MPKADLAGVSLNYMQLPPRGNALSFNDDIVMLHGLAANLAFWYAGAGRAMTRFGTVTLYDLRGHGRSQLTPTGYTPSDMADDLESLLDFLGIQRCHLVAHSFSGMAALTLALRSPERVKSLIMADIRVRPVQPQLKAGLTELPPGVVKGLQALEIEVSEGGEFGVELLTQIARLQLTQPKLARRAQSILFNDAINFSSPRSAQRWIRLMDESTLLEDVKTEPEFGRSDLQNMRRPMLLLSPAASIVSGSSKALASLCPNTILHEISDAGHFFPLTQPASFIRPTYRFLRRFNTFQSGPARRL